MRSTKKRYHVQWGNGIWKSWWTEKTFRRKKKAIKYALKMLARNSNVAPWRVLVNDQKTIRIVFEGNTNRNIRSLKWKYIEHFTDEDIDNYHKPPIVNGEERRKK